MENTRLERSSQIDVCVIAGDANQRELITGLLTQAGFTLTTAQTCHEGINMVNQGRGKVVVCDYELPDGDGIQICESLRRNTELAGSYFILMSAGGSAPLASDALNAGADDYLAKPIGHQELIARVHVGARMQMMHDQLRRAAMVDGLTGLYNHDHFNRILEHEMSRARRYGHPLALIMADMDFFKAINDTYGHLAGNVTLEETARILRECIRDVDTAARFGGEEFAIILPEARVGDAKQVAERIRTTLPRSLRVEELHEHVVTASFGVADSEDPRVRNAADLVDLTDRALYLAKRRGRNQVAFCGELDEASEFSESLQTDEIESLRRRVAVLCTRAKDVYVQSVYALLQALEEKDPHTARHALNVAYYAEQIARQMGFSDATAKTVYNAALLHDVGTVGVPDRILLKRQPLTPLERMVMDQVPLIATRIVDRMRILESEIPIIRHQREYYDGSGFPAGLQGDQIPVGARILLVADAFDSMTTDRVYRQRRPIDAAVAELDAMSGTQFDPRAVKALKQILDQQRPAWEQRIDETTKLTQLSSNLQTAAAIEPG